MILQYTARVWVSRICSTEFCETSVQESTVPRIRAAASARVSIGLLFAEFCKRLRSVRRPWFSRSDHVRSIRSGPHRLEGGPGFSRDCRHMSGYDPGSRRAARAVRGRCGRLRAALWRLRAAPPGLHGERLCFRCIVATRRSSSVRCFAMVRNGSLQGRPAGRLALSRYVAPLCAAMRRFGGPAALARDGTV